MNKQEALKKLDEMFDPVINAYKKEAKMKYSKNKKLKS